MTYSRHLETADSASGEQNGLSPALARPRVLRGGRRTVIGAGIALALLVAVVVGGRVLTDHGSRPAQPPPIPVVLGTAKAEDVLVYASGIGAVQASNTVTVKVRVDGEIQRVAFVEGQDVRAGDLLAQIDPRPYQAQAALAEANRARDEAQLANARRDLDRSLALVDRGFASRQSVDTLRATVDQSIAAVRGDQAQIDAAKLQITYSIIRAPIGGRTGVRLVDQGNLVRATDNTGLVVITQLEPVAVLFTLPQEQFDAVTTAMADRAALTVFAYGRENSAAPRAEGALLLLNNQIDPTTGAIQLKAMFPNTDHRLWPGQFVNINLLLDTQHNVVTVPGGVVQNGPDGPFAYVVKADHTAEVRPLQVGQIRDNIAVIKAGLSAGEQVVVDGQYKLKPGSRVVAQSKGPTADVGSVPQATGGAP